MKDMNGWNKEREEHSLVIQKPQFKKIPKGKCGYCGKYGHKAADCYKRKANQEKKNIGGVFQPSEQVNNNNYQQRKPMWMQNDPRRRRK